MAIQTSAPWHKASFDAFLKDSLPRLLAERVPLASYYSESTSAYSCRLRILLATKAGELVVDLPDVPQPDADGVFQVDSQRYVVLPLASSEKLDQAQVRCVGEQLYEFVERRLGEAPADLAWDENLARTWLPIDAWVREFIQASEPLDERNWLTRCQHLRRLRVLNCQEVFDPSQVGRTCPLETPEGTNIGQILHVVTGAEIRDGKLVIVDSSPQAALGVGASMVPFLEHNDPNRQLMGVNMMRQWLPGDQAEPALVQTGNEPAAEDFWCGRNLLTAFISWGIDTHEDGIIISASAAAKMNQGRPLEPGDKLSNRHGTKGVIARIVPDERMPHLPDGTAVELVYNWIGLEARLNFGQMREAIMGRVARIEGHPAVVPPFAAPSAEQLQDRLKRAGLCPSGMETLRAGRNGPELDHPSTVGWIYWGKTVHLAADKIHAAVRPSDRAQRQAEPELLALRDIGAFETIREHFNTRAAGRADADTLADRVAAGDIQQVLAPAPSFADVVRRLAAGGIRAALSEQGLSCRFEETQGEGVELAVPLPHPWAEGRQIRRIGVYPGLSAYEAVVAINNRLKRMQEQRVPETMMAGLLRQLEQSTRAFFDALLSPVHVRPDVQTLFTGRAVTAPGPDLRHDQIGLAEEIAWTIFGPLVARKIGAAAVSARTGEAAAALDQIMATSWLIVHRAPTIMPASFLAFHPVRIPDRVIRLHTLSLMLLNADFDGDQVAVFLPLTQAGQREAGEKLTIAAHVSRDPGLVRWLSPPHAAMWGLASLSLTPAGREQIDSVATVPAEAPKGFVTRGSLEAALRAVLQRDGADRMLQVAGQLIRLGFDQADRSGASMSPFVGESLSLPPAPAGDDPEVWNAYSDEIAGRIASYADFDDSDLGSQVLAVSSGARGNIRHLVVLLGSRGALPGLDGKPFIFRRGWVEGLPPEQFFVATMHARRALGQVALDTTRAAYDAKESARAQGLGVLVRAMRSARPGVVFARAAATGEIDPLTDLDSRLFVGLPVTMGADPRISFATLPADLL